MFEKMKAKTWRKKLPLLAALLAVVLAVLVNYGTSLVVWAMGPRQFEQMEQEDAGALEGRYVQAEITTLMDYYAETVKKVSGRPEEVTARDYLMPVAVEGNNVVYLGLRVSKKSLRSANAVVNDTIRMMEDMDDSYVWDGSYVSVQGTFQRMDSETEEIYRSYLVSELGVEESLIGMDSWFLPLVLVDGQIGRANRGVLTMSGLAALVALVVLLWTLRKLSNGSYQQSIRSYLATLEDPELALQSLERFYEDTEGEGSLRTGRDWLVYDNGAKSWVLAAEDVAWAYLHVARQKNGIWTVHEDISVRVFSVSQGPLYYDRIPAFTEGQAREILEKLFQAYPGLAVGYDLDLQQAYSTDPAAFRAATLAARTGVTEMAEPAPEMKEEAELATETEQAQEEPVEAPQTEREEPQTDDAGSEATQVEPAPVEDEGTEEAQAIEAEEAEEAEVTQSEDAASVQTEEPRIEESEIEVEADGTEPESDGATEDGDAPAPQTETVQSREEPAEEQ